MDKKLYRNVLLFHLYSLFSKAHFQRGIFVLFLLYKGFSGAQIGILQTVLFLVNALAEVPTGMLGDRVGRRYSVLIGLSLAAVNGVAQVAFGGFWIFAVIFASQGLAFAFTSGSDTALFYDSLKALDRETDYVRLRGRLQAISGASLAAAMVVGGLLQGASWTLVYLAYSAAMLVGAGVVALMFEVPVMVEAGAAAPGQRFDVRDFFASAAGRALLPLIVASALLHATLTPYFVFAQDVFDAKGVPVFLIGALYAMVSLFGGLAALLADRLSRRVSLPALFTGTVVALGACVVCNAWAGPGLAVAAFLVAATVPEICVLVVENHLQERIPSSVRASALSSVNLIDSAFTGVSYLVLGMLIDRLSPAIGVAWLAPLTLLSLACGWRYFASLREFAPGGAVACD